MKILLTFIATVLLSSFMHLAAEAQNPVPVAVVIQKNIHSFSDPGYEGYRLDWCLDWGDNCGPRAAQQYCRQNGYTLAIDWKIAEDIGAKSPTFVMRARKICDQEFCDGFSYIVCKLIEKKPSGSPDSGRADSPRGDELLKLVILRTAQKQCQLIDTQTTSDVIAGPFDVIDEAQKTLQSLKDAGACAK